MTDDPLGALRAMDERVAPDPGFAARLRARVAAALAQPPTTIDLPERRATVTTAQSTTTATITPYLCVADAKAALAWYADAFGAVEEVRYEGDDGRIGHAEISIDGARVMLSDEYAGAGVAPPPRDRGTSVTLHLDVADVDTLFARAVARGAAAQREPADRPYGARAGSIVDPFGHRWMIQTTIAAPNADEIDAAIEDFRVTAPEVPVELGYFTLGFDDTERAGRFYGELFGWRARAGPAGPGYAHVGNTRLPLGFTPDGAATAPVLFFRVDRIEPYATRVVELGGTVVETNRSASGANAVCRDDQGREFRLYEPAPGY